jgi:uncharacterized phage-associated protein
MYDARFVANFFLDEGEKNKTTVSIMTLLKVLYFAHAWHLVKYKRPLVAQPFEAWEHGPVVRVVYEQYKAYGPKPIDKKATLFDPRIGRFVVASHSFSEDTCKFLSDIYRYYSIFHPFKLSDLTHEKGGPWDVVWTKAEKSAVPGMVIPNEVIADWFGGQNALYWTDRERRSFS